MTKYQPKYQIYLNAIGLFLMICIGNRLYAQQNTQKLCYPVSQAHYYQVDMQDNGGEGTGGSTYQWKIQQIEFVGNITNLNTRGNQIKIDWNNTQVGVYTLRVTETNSTGCSDVKELNIELSNCGNPKADKLEIYHVITPNNDGYNDVWHVKGIQLFPNASVDIYNRFNKLIYHGEGADNCQWDGTYLGKPVPSSDYWYVLHLGNGITKTGHITVKNQ